MPADDGGRARFPMTGARTCRRLTEFGRVRPQAAGDGRCGTVWELGGGTRSTAQQLPPYVQVEHP